MEFAKFRGLVLVLFFLIFSLGDRTLSARPARKVCSEKVRELIIDPEDVSPKAQRKSLIDSYIRVNRTHPLQNSVIPVMLAQFYFTQPITMAQLMRDINSREVLEIRRVMESMHKHVAGPRAPSQVHDFEIVGIVNELKESAGRVIQSAAHRFEPSVEWHGFDDGKWVDAVFKNKSRAETALGLVDYGQALGEVFASPEFLAVSRDFFTLFRTPFNSKDAFGTARQEKELNTRRIVRAKLRMVAANYPRLVEVAKKLPTRGISPRRGAPDDLDSDQAVIDHYHRIVKQLSLSK